MSTHIHQSCWPGWRSPAPQIKENTPDVILSMGRSPAPRSFWGGRLLLKEIGGARLYSPAALQLSTGSQLQHQSPRWLARALNNLQQSTNVRRSSAKHHSPCCLRRASKRMSDNKHVSPLRTSVSENKEHRENNRVWLQPQLHNWQWDWLETTAICL